MSPSGVAGGLALRALVLDVGDEGCREQADDHHDAGAEDQQAAACAPCAPAPCAVCSAIARRSSSRVVLLGHSSAFGSGACGVESTETRWTVTSWPLGVGRGGVAVRPPAVGVGQQPHALDGGTWSQRGPSGSVTRTDIRLDSLGPQTAGPPGRRAPPRGGAGVPKQSASRPAHARRPPPRGRRGRTCPRIAGRTRARAPGPCSPRGQHPLGQARGRPRPGARRACR